MRPILRPSNLAVAVIVALSLVAWASIYYMTRWGPAIYSDSVLYLLSAKNLVEHSVFGIIWSAGHVEPPTVHSPLYPVMLAILHLLGADVVQAARFVGAFSFSMVILATGLVSYSLTRRSDFAISLCAVLLVSPLLTKSFSSAMSEPLFFMNMVLGLLTLLVYLQTGSRVFLVLSAICSSLAFLTRFVGIAIPITCIIGILLFPTGAGRKRSWTDALLFGIPVTSVMLLGLAWNYLFSGTVSGLRQIAGASNYSQMLADFLRSLYGYLWDWLTLGSGVKVSGAFQGLTWVLIIGTFAISVVLISVRFLRAENRNRPTAFFPWVIIFCVFIIIYLVVYFLAYMFTRPTIDLNLRIFLPVYIAVIMLIFGWLGLISEAWSQRWLVWLSWALTIVLVAVYAPRTVSYAQKMHSEGVGYLSRDWLDLRLVRALRTLPEDLAVVTNEPAFVKFLSDQRPVYTVPESVGRPAGAPGARFGDNSGAELAESAFRRGAALALFPTFHAQLSALYGNEVGERRLQAITRGLVVYVDFGDSGIYFYGPQFVP